MRDKIIKPLQEIEVVRLLKYIRHEEENEHIAQLCADISSEFAHIARFVSPVGFSLSEEWKAASGKNKDSEHLVLTVKEYKTRLMALHIRSTGDHDNQGVDVSQNILRRRESNLVHFSLPSEFVSAKNHILAQLFSAFPSDRLLVKGDAGEMVPLFEEVVAKPPRTNDEGVLKERALAEASNDPDAKMILSPYADDNRRPRSFSR